MQLPRHPLQARPRRTNRRFGGWAALAWLLTASGPGLVAQDLTPPAPVPATPAASAPAPAPEESQANGPVFEEWVVLVLDGKQCGFGSTITTRNNTPDGPQFSTVHEEQFVVKRLDTSLKITETSKVTEDAEGGVLSFENLTEGAGSSVESSGVRQGDELVVSSRGQTRHDKIPRLSALGPEAVRHLCDAVPLKPGQPFTFPTFSSDYPQATVVESGKVVGQETHEVRGVERKLWKLSNETSVMPGIAAVSWVDDQSKDVEDVVTIPGIGDLHEYVTDRAECMKQPEGAEIFAATLIHPESAVPAPEKQGQAVYRLTTVDLTKTLALWNQGEQRVISSEPGSCDVEVTVPRYVPADAPWQLPLADTPELHRYLQASSYLEVNAPDIQALARQAVGDEKNPVAAANRIERFVRKYITKKDLNIGFASAEETAQSREGDCTEHAVLCAALGRAVGLPTRCVVGLGYVPPGVDAPTLAEGADQDTGTFAFHMWAEAWIGPDQWVPMDAALNGFDVGHIAITKTALEEVNPLVDLNAPIFQLMENLKIEVVKTVLKSKMQPPPPLVAKTPAPADATAPAPSPAPAPTASPAPTPEPSSAPVPPPAPVVPAPPPSPTLPGVD